MRTKLGFQFSCLKNWWNMTWLKTDTARSRIVISVPNYIIGKEGAFTLTVKRFLSRPSLVARSYLLQGFFFGKKKYFAVLRMEPRPWATRASTRPTELHCHVSQSFSSSRERTPEPWACWQKWKEIIAFKGPRGGLCAAASFSGEWNHRLGQSGADLTDSLKYSESKELQGLWWWHWAGRLSSTACLDSKPDIILAFAPFRNQCCKRKPHGPAVQSIPGTTLLSLQPLSDSLSIQHTWNFLETGLKNVQIWLGI